MKFTFSIAFLACSLNTGFVLNSRSSLSMAQEQRVAEIAPPQLSTAGDTEGFRFAFDRTSWREVVRWLADEADLALHMGELPQGTFTYTDPSTYELSEAIDRLNLFLIPEGYAIVRSKKLLTVIELGDERGRQQLEVLAELVSLSELAEIEPHRVVRCLLPLGEVSASQALSELETLTLFTPPKSLSASKQLMLTGTAARLRDAAKIVDSLGETLTANQQVVQTVQLQHLDFEAFLDIARPHLGIEVGSFGNQRLNMTTDESKHRIFVTGEPKAVELLSELVSSIDLPNDSSANLNVERVLVSHRVEGDNLQTVYDVLVTLLADQPVRLTKEDSTSSIVALADNEVHQIIERTIGEMQGSATEFVVIPLRTLDPYFAISLLDEMFDFSQKGSTPAQLRIDADPKSRRLFVRGSSDKVAEISRVVERLDKNERGQRERLIPLSESQARRVLQLSTESWLGHSPVISEPSIASIKAEISEHVVNADTLADSAESISSNPPEEEATSVPTIDFVSTSVSLNANENEPIRAVVTEQGIVVDSTDPAALAEFEEHVREVARATSAQSVRTAVYYLKYSTADNAVRMLADLLDAAATLVESSSSAELINAAVSSPRMLGFGSYLRKSEGSAMVSAGTLTVVADSRLNRIVCLGTDDDIQLVEQYLSLIDKDQSLTDIEIHGRTHVIELLNTEASEIIEVVREAFGDRVTMSNEERKRAAENQSREAREKGQPEVKVQTSQSSQAKMTLAMHERSNSLIVTAPDPLFAEVEKLVQQLDTKGEEAVEVVWYPDVTGLESLRESLSGRGSSSRSSSSRRDGRRN